MANLPIACACVKIDHGQPRMKVAKTEKATDIRRDIQFTACFVIVFAEFIFKSLFSNKNLFSVSASQSILCVSDTEIVSAVRLIEYKHTTFPIGFDMDFQ